MREGREINCPHVFVLGIDACIYFPLFLEPSGEEPALAVTVEKHSCLEMIPTLKGSFFFLCSSQGNENLSSENCIDG